MMHYKNKKQQSTLVIVPSTFLTLTAPHML